MNNTELIEKLKEYRSWLVEKTDEYNERAKNPNNSSNGTHFERGAMDGFIKSRAKLEMLFDLW